MPYAMETFEHFSKVHGFEVLAFDRVFSPKLHPSWNKLLAILSGFKRGYDWVFWSDADSLYIGNTPKLDYSNEFVTWGDANGLCMSHMLVKNTEYNRRLFEAMLVLGDVKDDSKFGKGPKWEQNALKALRQNWDIPVAFLPPKYVGEPLFPDTLHPDNQFLHYAVMDNQKRLEMIKTEYEHRNFNNSNR